MKQLLLIISAAFLFISSSGNLFSQFKKADLIIPSLTGTYPKQVNINDPKDTIRQKPKMQRFSTGGIFISVGGGFNVPLSGFSGNSLPAFGILGRIELTHSSFFPFVVGGEVSYFSYSGDDQFKTTNLLANYKTRILSFGLNIEYVLSKLFTSSYTIPFVTIDIKSNNIKREYDETVELGGLPRTASKISVGAGFGFTLFIFDFYTKYNYMSEMQNFGVYTKVKLPVIRF